MDTVEIICPACRYYPSDGYICDSCKRILDRGICMIIFYVMETGFGAAMGIAVATGSYVATSIFALVAFMSAFLVMKSQG